LDTSSEAAQQFANPVLHFLTMNSKIGASFVLLCLIATAMAARRQTEFSSGLGTASSPTVVGVNSGHGVIGVGRNGVASASTSCPSSPPPSCSSDCQCMNAGSFYFYKCGGLWCNNMCQGCHSSSSLLSVEEHHKASSYVALVGRSSSSDGVASGSTSCPASPPASCSSDCQCMNAGSFYFYKCGGLWCNNICQGCHSSSSLLSVEENHKASSYVALMGSSSTSDGVASGSSSLAQEGELMEELKISSANANVHEVNKSGVTNDALINEYYDRSMGIAFSMLPVHSWGGSWGLASRPGVGKGKFLSIMTNGQDMSTYKGQAYGLALHITEDSGFWKYFQVICCGRDAGNIVGGPGDGGSHTPGFQRRSVESMGKDYKWFTSQKARILARYNTVYGVHDYNEFITKGLSKSAVAGILHYTRSHSAKPSDGAMCNFLRRNVHGGKWPIYAYDRTSLRIERYLNC